MRKRIAIIHDDMHSLLLKVQERLVDSGIEAEFVPWQSLAISDGIPPPLLGFDLVYLDRMGEDTRSYTTQLSLLVNAGGSRIVNDPLAYAMARNKALSAIKLRAKGIPTPPTAIVYEESQVEIFYRTHNFNNFIAKSIYGYCAYDLYTLARGERCTGLQELLKRDGMAVVQAFIPNRCRYIWRVDVVNGAVIVANQRFSFNSEADTPICNGTQGGEIRFWRPTDMPDRVRELALMAMQGMKLEVGGVDILPADDGSLFVLEVNPEPDITMDRFEFPYAIADYLGRL